MASMRDRDRLLRILKDELQQAAHRWSAGRRCVPLGEAEVQLQQQVEDLASDYNTHMDKAREAWFKKQKITSSDMNEVIRRVNFGCNWLRLRQLGDIPSFKVNRVDLRAKFQKLREKATKKREQEFEEEQKEMGALEMELRTIERNVLVEGLTAELRVMAKDFLAKLDKITR